MAERGDADCCHRVDRENIKGVRWLASKNMFVSLVTTHKTQEERWNRIEFIAIARSVTVNLVHHTPTIVQ